MLEAPLQFRNFIIGHGIFTMLLAAFTPPYISVRAAARCTFMTPPLPLHKITTTQEDECRFSRCNDKPSFFRRQYFQQGRSSRFLYDDNIRPRSSWRLARHAAEAPTHLQYWPLPQNNASSFSRASAFLSPSGPAAAVIPATRTAPTFQDISSRRSHTTSLAQEGARAAARLMMTQDTAKRQPA